MSVPGFQEVFRPFLEILSDKEEHYLREMYTEIADYFQLSEEDRSTLLPSGKQRILNNRIGWAGTYLKKAGLIVATRQAHFRITERGLQALTDPTQLLNVKYLKQYPEFLEFHGSHKKKEKENDLEQTDETPLELLESSYERLKNELSEEILSQIIECSPEFFERLVIELLVRMGYGGSLKEAGECIGRSGDEGIDGIIKEDKLGLGFVYIQAKRWNRDNPVSRPEIQKFVGALQGQQATKGVFFSTSYFTKGAIEYAGKVNLNIVLVSGDDLANYMFEHDLGVTLLAEYRIKKLDSDYFEDE